MLQGGGEMGEFAAPGEEILVESVGSGDGAAGADRVDDLLLLGDECDFYHENLIRTTR